VDLTAFGSKPFNYDDDADDADADDDNVGSVPPVFFTHRPTHMLVSAS